MKRSIHSLPSIPLNHDSGKKKVLFNYLDADTPCRQISIANFHAGDVCEEHTHETLDEHFYWQQGSGVFCIDGQEVPFEAGDYIYVPARSAHSIRFSQDSQCVCIGIALDWESAAVVNPANEIQRVASAFRARGEIVMV